MHTARILLAPGVVCSTTECVFQTLELSYFHSQIQEQLIGNRKVIQDSTFHTHSLSQSHNDNLYTKEQGLF